MLLLKTQNYNNLFSFKKYFILIAKLYICIISINITNSCIKYSYCGSFCSNILIDVIYSCITG